MVVVYIVEACRSSICKRGKGLAGMKPADLLGVIQKAALDRSGIAPESIDQVVGGCVSQVGEQTFNIARIAWLSQGLPLEVPSTTVDAQCGSSQQATTMAATMVGSGVEDVVMSCGLEMMSRVPLGSAMKDGSPMGENYASLYQPTSQFMGAAMIAEEYQITRADTDNFGLESQQKAIQAWEEGRFDREIVPVDAPVLDEKFEPSGEIRTITKDEGLRETTLESLEGLAPVPGQDLHTAGSSSQVSDGAAAVIMASREACERLGAKPRAKIIATTLVGVDPVTMLKGPIPATRKVLERAGLTLDDIDIFEVNEAFASVVLAWEKDLSVDHRNLNKLFDIPTSENITEWIFEHLKDKVT